MSFGIRVLGVRDVDAESAMFTLGSTKERAVWGQVVALPPVEDGALTVQLFDEDDKEVGAVNVDLHTVEADSSEWFTLQSGQGAVQLHFEVLQGAVVTQDEDPFGAPVSSGNNAPQAEESEEEESEEEEEEEESSEPTPLMLWQQKHNEELIERATAARAKRDERKTTSREWIKKFYEDRDGKLAAKQKLNRQQNQQLIDKITANLGQGHIWERVTNLINMGPQAVSRKGVDRMRTVLLQVKNNTPAHLARHDQAPAVAAGGSRASGSNDFF